MASLISSVSSTSACLRGPRCCEGKAGKYMIRGNILVNNSHTHMLKFSVLQGNTSEIFLVVASGKQILEGNSFLNRQDSLSNGKSRTKQVNRSWRNHAVKAGMKEAQELVIAQKIKVWRPKEAGKVLLEGTENWKMLDVRPIWERERAFVSGSLHVPLFVVDDDNSFLTAIKRQIQFGFGGWWLGQKLTKRNESFVKDVRKLTESVDVPIMLACGEGLRSLMAVEELHDAGFRKLGWIVGGLNNSRDGDFVNVEGDTKLHLSTAGGVQGILIKVGQYVDGLQKGASSSS